MNVLFVRPPRHYWPLMSPAGAFWQPLAFACLAAQVRRELPDCAVRILDAPILKMGWRSLAAELARSAPDVVCIGDEVSVAPEGLRLARLVREITPRARIIAGGPFFGPMAHEILPAHPIDFIVRGEGEETLVAILRAIVGGCRGRGVCDHADLRTETWSQTPRPRHPAIPGRAGAMATSSWPCSSPTPADPIPGAVFRHPDGHLVDGGLRPLIADLDSLPMPAWDLLPMPLYGRGARSHRLMATLEHSRGCIGSCNFCILWRQMGRPTGAGGDVTSCWRTKSPERSFDEVRLLYEQFGRRTFCWTDPTWNASPEWTSRFCDLLLGWGRKIEMVAWLRADCVVRDQGLGLLDKQVAAGLRRVMIGLERPDDGELAAMGKPACGLGVSRQAMEILSRHPQVYTIASLLFGLPDESPQSLDRLVRYGGLADATVFLPLTPNPGTPEWHAARRDGRLVTEDFARYNFLNPVLRTRRYEPAQLMRLYGRAVARNTVRSAAWWLWNFRRPTNRGKLGLAARLGWRAARIAAHNMISGSPVLDRRPPWYDD